MFELQILVRSVINCFWRTFDIFLYFNSTELQTLVFFFYMSTQDLVQCTWYEKQNKNALRHWVMAREWKRTCFSGGANEASCKCAVKTDAANRHWCDSKVPKIAELPPQSGTYWVIRPVILKPGKCSDRGDQGTGSLAGAPRTSCAGRLWGIDRTNKGHTPSCANVPNIGL